MIFIIAATKPNALLANFFSHHNVDRLCLNYFCNFRTDDKLKQHQRSCENNVISNWKYLKSLKRY